MSSARPCCFCMRTSTGTSEILGGVPRSRTSTTRGIALQIESIYGECEGRRSSGTSGRRTESKGHSPPGLKGRWMRHEFLVSGRPTIGAPEIVEVVESLRSGWVGGSRSQNTSVIGAL
jgi:hypothetical protein